MKFRHSVRITPGWYRWKCVKCGRLFRRRPYSSTCPNDWTAVKKNVGSVKAA